MIQPSGPTGDAAAAKSGGARASLTQAHRDLVAITKARLSLLVVITALCGYFAAARAGGEGVHWMTALHILIGTALAAFGSAVFNQLMEVDADARMFRTADRPLPARRMPHALAFVMGWLLAAFGIIHLGMKVNPLAAALAAATLLSYLFVYTPMKRRTSWNTIVGAVSGALPPLIGWVGGGQPLFSWGGLFLFAILFLWQLPHFVAINWMYREEYERGGFVMWSNGDESGARTARLALGFSLVVAVFPLLPVLTGVVSLWFLPPGFFLGWSMAWLAARFFRSRKRVDARRLFFFTLLYLPLILTAALLTWRSPAP
ncbi:MAG: heme o synthase [Verrucomicrobiae bacterium]|nr:heme o synthase [Verrucomicrobiae bacterium]